ncbi:MAG: hypothetical protein U0V74_09325 [Chitinophagales bacterium]
MRKQDYLIQLIRALGTNEKRYFKLFSNLQPGEKRYLRLFDALENREQYDTAKLCDEFELTPKQLTDDKYYLTQALLHSLRNYDTESSEIALLRANKENARSLLSRRMFDYAIDLLQKTIEKAWVLEAFEHISELLLLRSLCLQNAERLEEDDNMLAQQHKASLLLNELVQLYDLRKKARNLEVKGSEARAFKNILSHPLIKNGVNKLQSLRSKSVYYEIMAHYYSSSLMVKELLQSSREERKLYLKNPQIRAINPIVYLTNITRLTNGEPDHEVRLELIVQLHKELHHPEIAISPQRANAIRWRSMLLRLWSLRHLGRFKEALRDAEKYYAENENRNSYDHFSITFELILALMMNGRTADAVEKVDELMREKSDVRSDMQPFIRLLNIMVQLELGNYTLIPHLIKSSKAWLKKNNVEHGELSLFFKHANAIATTPLNKRTAYQQFKKDIDDGKLQKIDELIHLGRWVEGVTPKTNEASANGPKLKVA